MTDNISRDPQSATLPPAGPRQATPPRDTEQPEADGFPLRLVGGNASPDELSAVVAVVLVLASASNDDAGPGEPPATESGAPPRSQWSSPARLVRTTYPHGPGGWRASAAPR